MLVIVKEIVHRGEVPESILKKFVPVVVVLVEAEESALKDDSDEYVLGIGDDLQFQLVFRANQVEKLNPLHVLRTEILENLLDDLGFNLGRQANSLPLLH